VPELPEVETIARELQSLVAGAKITDVVVTRSDVLRGAAEAEFRRRLRGQTIVRCWRRAKFAVLDLSSGWRICVQPRFTGMLLVEQASAPLPRERSSYSTLFLQLGDGRRLHYVDVRRLGTVELMSAADFAEHDSSLGIEPLAPEFTPEVLSGLLRGSSQAIKKFIMNQQKIAGVGNIYANEALWQARIDPSRASNKVSRDESDLLHAAIVEILARAIESRGTSFRDYRDASGEPGEFFSQLSAYGREGLPCPRCNSRMVGTHEIDGRATVLCVRCQR
jgi:formamidopyrimidine-DNA glycosylase